MSSSAAIKRYLEHYLEDGIQPPTQDNCWSHCLIIPVFQESACVLEHWRTSQFENVDLLVIFIINRPDNSHEDANEDFRKSAQALEPIYYDDHIALLRGDRHTNDLLIVDLDRMIGPLPQSEGVGRARKFGSDLALSWHVSGHIQHDMLCNTDADATLPPDYFDRLPERNANATVCTYPFVHVSGADQAVHAATLWYELWLHHYVLGLEYALSPYAYHSLGSCIAINAACYAQVGGFPKRAAAEDFYLLNKANKVSKVVRLGGAPILLQSRRSSRAPFGTGPGVAKIMATPESEAPINFHHPQSFAALRIVLLMIPKLYKDPTTDMLESLIQVNMREQALAAIAINILKTLGVDKALRHCQAHGKTPEQFAHQFHQWFDGFRTMKFINAVRQKGWQDQAFNEVLDSAPNFWPASAHQDMSLAALQKSVHQHWGWQ